MRVLDLKINKPIQMQGLGFSNWQHSQIVRLWATLACALNHFILYWLYWPSWPILAMLAILNDILATLGCAPHHQLAHTLIFEEQPWVLTGQKLVRGQKLSCPISQNKKQRRNPKPGHLRGWKSFSELNAMRANMPVGPIVATAVVKLLKIHWKPKL